jgi:alkyl hydroperoxide reductase subunit AhpC
MISVGKKTPKWRATVYDNGKKEQLSSSDLAGSWYLMYWWPFDFTGVCNSEVLGFQALEEQFKSIGVQLIGASCDSFHSHRTWFGDSVAFPNGAPSHPIVADNKHNITKNFGFYNKAIGCAVRATVLVDPDGVVRSASANFLPVARDPQDALTTARAFVAGGACPLPKRADYAK